MFLLSYGITLHRITPQLNAEVMYLIQIHVLGASSRDYVQVCKICTIFQSM